MMKDIRFIRGAWVLLLAVLVLAVSAISPALASGNIAQHAAHTTANRANKLAAASTSIAATIYATAGTIEPQFQARISQDVPQSFSNAITQLIGKLPQQDQGWALTMATTLIQPSGTLKSMVTQQNGLAMTIQIALYPGDPKPTTSTLLLSFSVLDSSTIQVSGSTLSGPTLASGPLETITIPLGTVSGVHTTPSCGDSALAFNLQIPVALQGQSPSAAQGTAATANPAMQGNPMVRSARAHTNADTNTFIEIPAASLKALGSSFGSISMGSSLTAQNIRIAVQGSNIHILSDVYWSGLNVGTADSTLVPEASGGNLVMHVTSTNFNLFGIFSINENSYDQQIEQTINSKLSNAFAGQFTVTQAQIGPDSALPCAKSDSLVLTGSSSIG
jgi:hypothetical protein